MITEYKLKNGETRYEICLYLGIDENTGRKIVFRKKGIKSSKDAQLLEARARSQYEDNGGLDTLKPKQMRFKEVFDIWILRYESTVKTNTFIAAKRAIELHILPFFGKYYINKLPLKVCQEAVNHWSKTYTKSTHLISLASRIIDFGITIGVCRENQMKKILRPKNTHKKHYESPFYTKEQLMKFLEYVEETEDFRTLMMFRLLAFTGLRKGEMLGLRWMDIDFKKSTLTVRQVLALGHGELVIQSPKTQASNRTVGIDPATLSLLKRWKLEQSTNLLKLGYNSNNPEQLVFTTKTNNYVDLKHPNRSLYRILEGADLPYITVHGFRHTHCSLLLDAGVKIREAQQRLGHSNAQTTMNIYAHLSEAKRDEATQMFSDFMSK